MTFLPELRRHLLPDIVRAVITLIAVVVAMWCEWPGADADAFADDWLRDHLVRAHASGVAETRLVVIDIDERSLAAEGPWPWPRERLATLVEQLLGPYAARGVALDLVLPEAGGDDGDQRLAMLSQHGPVVLPQAFDYNGNLPLRVGQLTGGTPGQRAGAVPASGYIANHAGLAQAAHIGNIGFIPDRDGMIRRLPLQTWFEGRRYPTLSRALLECCRSSPTGSLQRGGPAGGLYDGDGLQRLPYDRRWDAYAVIPASAVLQQTAPAELITDKLVLVGSSSLGLADRVATPLSPSTSGLLVHAAALSSQLDVEAGLAPAPWPGRIVATIFVATLAGMAYYTLARWSALSNIGLLAAASLLWLGLAYLTLPHDAAFSVAAPLYSMVWLLVAGVPFAWQQSQRQSRRLLGTLRQYVADAVVDELLRRNLSDALAPIHCEVTTLIADMQGYTGHVESLPLEEAALLTREFLDCLTLPVLAARGTLDKFTGDGLVAFWGAPLPVADHADQAIDAARAIVESMQTFNAQRVARALKPVRVRIGIESGTAMAGDFGSHSRSIYTAVGDSVNVASRLESTARDLPYDVIIGPGTAKLCRRHQLLEIGELVLRGREHATTLYTLAPNKGNT